MRLAIDFLVFSVLALAVAAAVLWFAKMALLFLFRFADPIGWERRKIRRL
ncbi:MAG: hypothetical protein LBR12_04875 [Opitutaceae bacterium]|jgi:hypothetical protein|nr:hypothetical protein [Opitutaceae bacterium]